MARACLTYRVARALELVHVDGHSLVRLHLHLGLRRQHLPVGPLSLVHSVPARDLSKVMRCWLGQAVVLP